MSRFTYDLSKINRGLDQYLARVRVAIRMVAEYYAPILESHAKTKAPWTDRTANARQSLHTFVEELSQNVVGLYLSHGMNYGIYLELRFAGKYAIIWPTIAAHLPAISRTLRQVFR